LWALISIDTNILCANYVQIFFTFIYAKQSIRCELWILAEKKDNTFPIIYKAGAFHKNNSIATGLQGAASAEI